MKTVLVNLVSEQTIPNFLSLKTFEGVSEYVFITTERMEDEHRGNRRKWLMQAAGLHEEGCATILVNPECFSDVIDTLGGHNWEQYKKIIVNITGGTKIMSLATYEFFKNRTGHIWYIPLNSTKYFIVDDSGIFQEVNHQITVKEYLNCCGIDDARFKQKSPCKGNDFTESFLNTFMFHMKHSDFALLEVLRNPYRQFGKKELSVKDMEFPGEKANNGFVPAKGLTRFLDRIKFPFIKFEFLTKYEIDYLTGGWFEEYVFNILQRLVTSPANIGMGINLIPQPKDLDKAKWFTANDLDVVFTNNNRIYIVECKTGMEEVDLYNKTVYLASALRRYFGLNVISILCTLSNMSVERKEKAETLGIIPITREVFETGNFESVLKTILQIK